MLNTTSLAAALALAATFALATPAASMEVSDEAKAKVEEVLAKVNCKGGTLEKEDSGVYEVDDAECDYGSYDVKMDENFNILVMSRD